MSDEPEVRWHTLTVPRHTWVRLECRPGWVYQSGPANATVTYSDDELVFTGPGQWNVLYHWHPDPTEGVEAVDRPEPVAIQTEPVDHDLDLWLETQTVMTPDAAREHAERLRTARRRRNAVLRRRAAEVRDRAEEPWQPANGGFVARARERGERRAYVSAARRRELAGLEIQTQERMLRAQVAAGAAPGTPWTPAEWVPPASEEKGVTPAGAEEGVAPANAADAADAADARLARTRAEGGRFDGVTDLTRLTDGRVMCCICFAYTPRERLWRDRNGATWDMCVTCGTLEEATIAARARGEVRRGHEPRDTVTGRLRPGYGLIHRQVLENERRVTEEYAVTRGTALVRDLRELRPPRPWDAEIAAWSRARLERAQRAGRAWRLRGAIPDQLGIRTRPDGSVARPGRDVHPGDVLVLRRPGDDTRPRDHHGLRRATYWATVIQRDDPLARHGAQVDLELVGRVPRWVRVQRHLLGAALGTNRPGRFWSAEMHASYARGEWHLRLRDVDGARATE